MLRRMLASAVENDQLKNWSVYEEKDGVYTFKIRFIPTKDRHIGKDSHAPAEVSHSSVACSYRRKSSKQLARDSQRNQDWNNRRVTRSQALKASSQDNSSAANTSELVPSPRINSDAKQDLESSLESFRHASIVSDVENPEFVPAELNSTERSVSDVDSFNHGDLFNNDDTFTTNWDCHFMCNFWNGTSPPSFSRLKLYSCLKCKEDNPIRTKFICEKCVSNGGHNFHRPYLELSKEFS